MGGRILMKILPYIPGNVQQFTKVSRNINFECLIKMRENALWAAEMANANGIRSEVVRLLSIFDRIEKAMKGYSAC